jgi:hypothetical protein
MLETLEDRTTPSIGSGFTISNSTLDDTRPATASSSNGMAVVVWSQETAAGQRNLFAKLYDAAGAQVGDTISVSNDNDDEFGVDVAMDAVGNFVVTWTRDFNNAGTDFDIHFALFSNTGARRVADPVTSSSLVERDAHVAMNAEGLFIVAYTRVDPSGDTDVMAIRYDADGGRLGRIKVAAHETRREGHSAIDMADNGRFAVSFVRSVPRNPDAQAVVVRSFGVGGKARGGYKIAVVTGDSVVDHDVGLDNAGNVTVVHDTGMPSGNENLFLRRVSAARVLGDALSLTTHTDFEGDPQLAVDRTDGDFVVAYRRLGTADKVFVREFSVNGTSKGDRDLGGGTSDASISISGGTNRYFVAYEVTPTASNNNIIGRFGTLT